MQYQPKNITKIYSRARIDLSSNKRKINRLNIRLKKNPKVSRTSNKMHQFMPILIILLIAFITFFLIWNSINPIFEKLCEDKAKMVATVITNEETTKVMKKYNYDNLFTVEKDEKGNIQMITANVLKVNQVTSDIALEIQKALDSNEGNKVYISLGAVTGIRFLSGIGPGISFKIASSGNIDTNIRSEFIAQGVNQTLHRVYLDIKTNVDILTSFSTIEKSIENQVLIVENVIVGQIPSTYYNFEGTNTEEALRIIE